MMAKAETILVVGDRVKIISVPDGFPGLVGLEAIVVELYGQPKWADEPWYQLKCGTGSGALPQRCLEKIRHHEHHRPGQTAYPSRRHQSSSAAYLTRSDQGDYPGIYAGGFLMPMPERCRGAAMACRDPDPRRHHSHPHARPCG